MSDEIRKDELKKNDVKELSKEDLANVTGAESINPFLEVDRVPDQPISPDLRDEI